LGQTKYGENFTNVEHPFDVLDVQYLDQLNWVPDPWVSATAQQIDAMIAGNYGISEKTWIDGKRYVGHSQHDMRLEVYNGILNTDPQLVADESPDNLPVPWEDYLHVWDPPTYWTWGMGIMYNIGSDMSLTLDQATTVYYKTVPLPPWVMALQPQLVVTPTSNTIYVGQTAAYIATYYPNGQSQGNGVDVTQDSVWSCSDNSIATPASTPGDFTGISPGTTTVMATYNPGDGTSLTAYYPSGGSQSGGQDAVTLLTYTQSENPVIADYFPSQSRYTWSSSDNTIATPASTPGLFMGVAPGQVTVTASYTPPVGSALAGTVVLNVQAQQPPSGGNNPPSNPVNPPTGSPGDATLTFNAVNQANIKTMTGQQIGGTLQRGPNIALWTDTVTATLSAPEPPQPTQIPNNGQFVKFNSWAITNATLNDIPAQNPSYAFGNPVEPVSKLPAIALTPQSSGPNTATAVSTGFEENWSEDGIGYTTSGPYGVKDVLTGQMMATTPESYQLSATYTLDYSYGYQYWVPGSDNSPGYWQTGTASGSTGPLTVTQDLWVCGTGAVPLTSVNQNHMVADTLNPQTHP
jgi:hypothetical protein